jgi:hypothetical protein
MARINIEECWWSDPRRSKLIRLLGGDTRKADGLAIEAWRLAQEFWKHDRKLVPLGHFEALEDSQFLIEAGLVKVIGDQVYVRGSSQYLEWVKEQRDIAVEAGKKSAEERRKRFGSAQPGADKNTNIFERNSNETRTPSNGIEPSVSGSVSDSGSSKNTNTYSVGEKADAFSLVPENLSSEKKLTKVQKKALKSEEEKKAGALAKRFIATYVKAYQKTYPAKGGGPPPRPDLRDKVQGQIKTYLAQVPIDRACELIQVYCQMEDQWFRTKCHDFGSFIENQNKVSLALDTGTDGSKPVRRSIVDILGENPIETA